MNEPHRTWSRELTGLVGAAAVAMVSAGFAHLFTQSGGWILDLVHGSDDPVNAARRAAPVIIAASVVATLLVAIIAARRGNRLASGLTGLSHVAAAARGEGPGPSLRATLVRSAGTWAASFGLGSIGRESAIIETGGALGTAAGRHREFGPSLAASGIAAAFATAYHAPIAGVLYAQEHLEIRQNRRVLVYTVLGAVVGHYTAVGLLGRGPVFPDVGDDLATVLVLGLVVVIPTSIAIRCFYEVRTRFTVVRFGNRRSLRVGYLAVAAILVATVPYVAGNGMAGLRHASADTVLQVGLAFAVVKFVATAAALGSGAPGGILSPTIAIAAGWSLVWMIGIESVGVDLPGDRWSGMVMAMVVGVAVGLRSPLVAIFLIPEMLGDLSLILPAMVIVLGAVTVDRAISTLVTSTRFGAIRGVRDEDA